MSFIDDVKFDENGLVPAIAQDYVTGEVLMLAYMNKQSLLKTLETKQAHYYSRSRKSLWLKGETSGHFQNIRDVRYDCDGDAVLLIVEQMGKTACHTGERSCFYRSAIGGSNVERQDFSVLLDIQNTIVSRRNAPKEGSYTNYLLEKGADKILKKIGEEAAEVIIATKNQDKEEIVYETSDLMYHLSVNLVNSGLSWEDIFSELKKR